MTVRHLNPDQLIRNAAFTLVVSIGGPVRTISVGGQNAVSASGEIFGKGDLGAQAEQVLRNLRMALAAVAADVEHLVKWTYASSTDSLCSRPLQPFIGFGAPGPTLH